MGRHLSQQAAGPVLKCDCPAPQPTSPATHGRDENLLSQCQSHGTPHLPPNGFPFRAFRLKVLAARINTQPSFRGNWPAPGDANRTGARQTSNCLSYALNGLARLRTAWLQMSGYDVNARVPFHCVIMTQSPGLVQCVPPLFLPLSQLCSTNGLYHLAPQANLADFGQPFESLRRLAPGHRLRRSAMPERTRIRCLTVGRSLSRAHRVGRDPPHALLPMRLFALRCRHEISDWPLAAARSRPRWHRNPLISLNVHRAAARKLPARKTPSQRHPGT